MDTLDLIVIGGGINGAALAEVTAAAGYRVALFEQNDFGSGVTSRSTRLIHGGLRYLEHGQVGLVRESLREREALLRDYPQLVRPLPFLIPAYRDDSRSRWWVRIGLEAYDWIGRSRLVERHRQLSAAETLRVEPGLASQGLRGGFVYYDCQIVYPERLALRMALNAEACGATVRNHTEVTGFLGEPQLVTGVRLRGGEELGARLVVNAAGPWADRVRGLLAGGKGRPLLSLLNGAHIVTGAFPGAPSHAIYHEASSDHRPFFVIPWRGLWLIGTTETPFDGDPALVRPTAAEIEYLLRETNLLFPQARLTRAAVLYSYAGPRPLLHSSAQTQAMSREHTIYDHEAEEGIAGVLTLVGGKLTTARAFARQALESIAAKLGPAPGPPAHPRPVPPDGDGSLGGAVTYAVRHEKARSLADILLRRTGLAFEPDRGFGVVPEIARLAAPLLGWDEAATGRALAAYRAELDQVLFREQP